MHGQTQVAPCFKPGGTPITLWIVTNRASLVSRLLPELQATHDFAVLGHDRSDHDRIAAFRANEAPTVLVLHCESPDLFDSRRLRRLARSHFPARVLWLVDSLPSAAMTRRFLLDFVQQGLCHGYVSCDRPVLELARAIRAIASGDLWLPRAMMVRALSERSGIETGWAVSVPVAPNLDRSKCQLTRREEDICELVRAALTNKEIGRQLGIVEDTVKKHLHHVYAKLGIRHRAQLLIRSLG